MRDHDFVSHDSPRSGSPGDRLQRAGLASGLVLENIGMAGNADALHQKFMATVGDRANLLNPQVTHAGVGVAGQPMADGVMLHATQLFVRLAEEIDVAAAPGTVLDQLNASRRARGASGLTRDAQLDEVASEAAMRFFRDPGVTERNTVEHANAQLERFAIAYRRVAAVMAVVNSLSEARALEPALDPEVLNVGVGVAQGDRPDTGPRAIAIVIVLAWPR